ncbi:MAG: TetR/AcrR family transcriptional regulator [Intrasporangium sp.]|uniref:TetR/AcrR family transcriptional regulator n=1 Tax=Intrasporangium sp. TaxID=1925024 RepID=UPI0026481009|nr:TetR/AcrR family transcriptional regulator [Intrasporangium sp.]MDN5795970.1 TetR/AcrR family transcriptional regulator [Intrasporangium sp.]
MAAKQGRAAPMAPDERREALADVYVRLARRYGRRPTTSEIAHEAGVAEGTIYRAFGTKEDLEAEAVEAAFCPGPVRRRIAAIDPDLTPRERLVEFTRLMQQRFTDVFGLMAALGLTQPPDPDNGHDACYVAGHHRAGTAGSCTRRPVHQPLLDSIHKLIDDMRDELTVEPADVIHRIRLLTFSASHPGIADGRLLTPEEIVSTVLDGVRVRAEAADSDIPRKLVDAHLPGASSVVTDLIAHRTPQDVAEVHLHATNRKGS